MTLHLSGSDFAPFSTRPDRAGQGILDMGKSPELLIWNESKKQLKQVAFYVRDIGSGLEVLEFKLEPICLDS